MSRADIQQLFVYFFWAAEESAPLAATLAGEACRRLQRCRVECASRDESMPSGVIGTVSQCTGRWDVHGILLSR